ncbi:MAG TPA: hypothetical protein VMZ91_12755 [Candidatus Paceibacterota bacterium]|nr:hypothetical protein [Candidatus Paceibacterota bacterium]
MKAINLVEEKRIFYLYKIKRLYLEEYMTFREIQSYLENKCSVQLIQLWLEQEGVLKKGREIYLLKWFKMNTISFEQFYRDSLKLDKKQLCEKYKCVYKIETLIKISRKYKEIRKMIELKKRRMTNKEIAQSMGYHFDTVGKILKKNMHDYEAYKIKRWITPQDIEKMIILKKKKITNEEIGQILGFKRFAIARTLKKEMKDYEKCRQRVRFSKQDIEKMIMLRMKGKKFKEIAQIMKCYPTSINRALRKYMHNYEK